MIFDIGGYDTEHVYVYVSVYSIRIEAFILISGRKNCFRLNRIQNSDRRVSVNQPCDGYNAMCFLCFLGFELVYIFLATLLSSFINRVHLCVTEPAICLNLANKYW